MSSGVVVRYLIVLGFPVMSFVAFLLAMRSPQAGPGLRIATFVIFLLLSILCWALNRSITS